MKILIITRHGCILNLNGACENGYKLVDQAGESLDDNIVVVEKADTLDAQSPNLPLNAYKKRTTPQELRRWRRVTVR